MISTANYGGFFAGLALVIIVVGIILMKRKKEVEPKFDEMQYAARGKAFKEGFYGLLLANAVGMLLSTCEISWLPDLFIFSAASIAGIAVFCVSAVLNDAYFGFNENRRSGTLFIAALGLLNLALGLIHIFTEGILEDGTLNTGVMTLFVAFLSAVILIAILVHKKRGGTSEDEGDNE